LSETDTSALRALTDEIVEVPTLFVVRGTLWQQPEWDTVLEGWMAKLEAAESGEEFSLALGELDPSRIERRPAPGIVVTLTKESFTRTAVTDSEGRYEIVAPYGTYEISAELPARSARTGEQRMMRAGCGVDLRSPISLDLELSTDHAVASVRGRVIDAEGRPVAGAKVTGTQGEVDPGGMHSPATYSAITDQDGFYELQDLEPTDFYGTFAYLATGSPGALARVNISVEADGFAQEGSAQEVPLVTEDGLYWGRRILRAYERQVEGEPIEKEGLALPSRQGNVIAGVDIVLTRADR